MFYFLSDIVVLLHFGYIIFSIAGGLVCLWRPKIVWLHLPAALWATLISLGGWICPLTYLEDWLRIQGGSPGYSEGFIVKYLEPILYPAGITHCHQAILGIMVVVLNLAAYGWVYRSTGWFLVKRKEA